MDRFFPGLCWEGFDSKKTMVNITGKNELGSTKKRKMWKKTQIDAKNQKIPFSQHFHHRFIDIQIQVCILHARSRHRHRLDVLHQRTTVILVFMLDSLFNSGNNHLFHNRSFIFNDRVFVHIKEQAPVTHAYVFIATVLRK